MTILNPESVGNPDMSPVVQLSPRQAASIFGYWSEQAPELAPLVQGSATTDYRCCGEELLGTTCTRDMDHPGRHMAACTMDGHVRAAWPGRHAPCEADLTDGAA